MEVFQSSSKEREGKYGSIGVHFPNLTPFQYDGIFMVKIGVK